MTEELEQIQAGLEKIVAEIADYVERLKALKEVGDGHAE